VIFESAPWLFALLVLPLLAGAEAWLTRRDRDRLARLVARPLWGRVVRRPHERWRWVRLALLLLGSAGVIVALARPQWGIVREKIEREGVDVVLALDTSGSMATPDVAPNRFFLARQALLQLMTRLEGDRFALVAFEGEAYPLAPLTLDADAVGLFLETVEPGIVPAPGTSLGVGLARGLEAFVDEERRNKVLVLVSDGEDLEGEVEDAVASAKEAGVVVHTVGVGTEAGQPVPEFDEQGRAVGYKRDESGGAVVSRLNTATLEAIAHGTGGQMFRLTAADTTLGALASTIEGMERKALAREWSYRRRERYQGPLALGLACLAAALVLPLPRVRRRATGAPTEAAALLVVLAAGALLAPRAHAQSAPADPSAAASPSATAPVGEPPAGESAEETGGPLDEVLLRPRRLTEKGRSEYAGGNHPQALEAFESAARTRPSDPVLRFNMADGLYKNGQYDEAAALFRSLGADPSVPLAPAARFNLGNSLYQKQDYPGAIRAYRDALRLTPNDEETRRNLELALRQLKEEEERQKRQQDQEQQQQDQQEQRQDQDGKDEQQGQEPQQRPQQGEEDDQQQQQQQQQQEQQRPRTPEEREDQRFREQTGMPKERAMQLLDALQENEKAEQRRLLAEQRAQKRTGRDW
jgi:Ca-activated chloride channel family protein